MFATSVMYGVCEWQKLQLWLINEPSSAYHSEDMDGFHRKTMSTLSDIFLSGDWSVWAGGAVWLSMKCLLPEAWRTGRKLWFFDACLDIQHILWLALTNTMVLSQF
ncbi:hypothetical protein BaRGS_00018565 [Batillaria attramentaria]|uniref:Uncharacterized protein n=1 Tax=Batillaria attramentaria TaxID=370345 RepID=A0ABD0KSS3_9CAEN